MAFLGEKPGSSDAEGGGLIGAGPIVPRGTIARAEASQVGALDPGAMERRLLAEIESLQDRLAEAERLAVLGQLTATIAHEFNNLLTPVMSYSEMALERPRDAALTKKALERAYEGSLKAGQISQAILSLTAGFGGLSSLSGGGGAGGGIGVTNEGADVGAAVDGALRCLGRDLAKDRIALRREIADGTRAAISAIGLQQVVLNLVLNARRAMLGGGGTLTVRGWVAADADVGATMSVATKMLGREGGRTEYAEGAEVSGGTQRNAGEVHGGTEGHGGGAGDANGNFANLQMANTDGAAAGRVGGLAHGAAQGHRSADASAARGKWVVVMVGDTGCGMTAGEMARVMGEGGGGGSREPRVANREGDTHGTGPQGPMAHSDKSRAMSEHAVSAEVSGGTQRDAGDVHGGAAGRGVKERGQADVAHGRTEHLSRVPAAASEGGGGDGSQRHRPADGSVARGEDPSRRAGVPGEGAVARGGAGLGLMLCRKLVAAAGGWMDGVSEVGRGTVVWVVVPWVGEGAERDGGPTPPRSGS
ncbi:MAG: sensor histidine kinase [Phycisphaerales bacterium]|nr:sensor histidine kinase [Phycisphaerales bacterium]